MADLILRGAPDGIGRFARAIGVSVDHARKIIAGTKAPPLGFDFEGLTASVEPLWGPHATSIDLDSIEGPWFPPDRFIPYLSPRDDARQPSVTVSVDGLVLVAERDDASSSALRARFATLCDGRSRDELLIHEGKRLWITIERKWKPSYMAKPHENYEQALLFWLFDASNDSKLLARLLFDPRRPLPAIRFEVTGEASSRGLALRLAREFLHPFVVAPTVLLQRVEVALDLAARAERFIVLHAPSEGRRAFGTATGEDKLGAVVLHLGSRGGVVVYDKLREIQANQRSTPPHAEHATHLLRIEARLFRKKRGFDGTPASALGVARSLLAEIAIADLANQHALGTSAWMLDMARHDGIVARPTTHATMIRPKKGEPQPDRFGMQGTVYRRLLEGEPTRPRGREDRIAYERSVLIHGWTLERVRRLAERTTWTLAEMLDEHAPSRVEPLLRALTTVDRSE